MLTRSGRPSGLLAGRRAPRPDRRLTVAVTLLAGVVAVLLPAAPAWADHVRDQQLWVLDAVHAPAAWQVTEGRGVTVAVIDSGVDSHVSDLAGSVTNGPDLTGVHTHPSNPHWGMHGTWMAALIAGHGHGPAGASGIIGVAPMAHILSVRVVTDKGDPGYQHYQRESDSQVQAALARAIRYATSHRARVISMSLGYGAPSLPVRAALQFALDHGTVVVASAGNSGDRATAHNHGQAPYSFPADYPGVLGVGAVAQDGATAAFSSANLSVQVAAPGVMVPTQGRDGKYWYVNGTSPACALTAGVAALIKAEYPRLAPSLVDEAITASAGSRPRGGYNSQVGFGAVDAAGALARARQLARGSGGYHGIAPAARFGGGPAAIPPAPVRPRSGIRLILYSALAAGCLAGAAVIARWLARARRRPAGAAPPGRRRARSRRRRPAPGPVAGPGERGPGERGPGEPGPGEPGPAPGMSTTPAGTTAARPAGGYPGDGSRPRRSRPGADDQAHAGASPGGSPSPERDPQWPSGSAAGR